MAWAYFFTCFMVYLTFPEVWKTSKACWQQGFLKVFPKTAKTIAHSQHRNMDFYKQTSWYRFPSYTQLYSLISVQLCIWVSQSWVWRDEMLLGTKRQDHGNTSPEIHLIKMTHHNSKRVGNFVSCPPNFLLTLPPTLMWSLRKQKQKHLMKSR